MMQIDLRKIGYPAEGIICVDTGGGNDYESPQEALSEHTCAYCRRFDHKEWVCPLDGQEKNPDEDTCDSIDYEEVWLDCQYGFRSPVRCEYSSDENYKKACEAIKTINRMIKADWEHDMETR